MGWKKIIRSALAKRGLEIVARSEGPTPTYDQDGLRTIHNADSLRDHDFVASYSRGIEAADADYSFHWRVHVGLWAASVAAKLEGDFVECGVNRGFLSSAIMKSLDWNVRGKQFWLLDTFAGIDSRFVTDEERAAGILERNEGEFYVGGVDLVRENFSEWERVRIVVGAVPESLVEVDCDQVAYLHLDMNCAPPEVAAFEFFWPKMVTGGIVLLDDYAYRGYESQKRAMDEVVGRAGVKILSLPTGQGLIVKTPG